MGILDIDNIVQNEDYDIEVWIRENYIILGELEVHNKIANVNGSVKYKHKSGSLTNNSMFVWGKVTEAFDITNIDAIRYLHILEMPRQIWGKEFSLDDKKRYIQGSLTLKDRSVIYHQNARIYKDGTLKIINFND